MKQRKPRARWTGWCWQWFRYYSTGNRDFPKWTLIGYEFV